MAFAAAGLLALATLSGTDWCGRTGTKNNTLANVQCGGMKPGKGAKSEAACAELCCASASCKTYLWATGGAMKGSCYLDTEACKPMTSPTCCWHGASTLPAPPPGPPPPPPPPLPPPPNGLRQELYAAPGCVGRGTPDMSYRLNACVGQEPYPHNATHNDQGSIVVGASGINGSSFELETFSSMACSAGGRKPYRKLKLVVGSCVNVTDGVDAVSYMWVRGWGQPPITKAHHHHLPDE